MAKLNEADCERLRELGRTLGLSAIAREMKVTHSTVAYAVKLYNIPIKKGPNSGPRVRKVGDRKPKAVPIMPVFAVSDAMIRLAKHDPVVARALRQKRGEPFEPIDTRPYNLGPERLHKERGRSLNPSPVVIGPGTVPR